MEAYIQNIEEAHLPNYVETIWSGGVSESREAPLLATYRVDLLFNNTKLELFFEVRNQPRGGPLVDEYYEDQVFDSLMSALSSFCVTKANITVYNALVDQITTAVFQAWEGVDQDFPIQLSTESI